MVPSSAVVPQTAYAPVPVQTPIRSVTITLRQPVARWRSGARLRAVPINSALDSIMLAVVEDQIYVGLIEPLDCARYRIKLADCSFTVWAVTTRLYKIL